MRDDYSQPFAVGGQVGNLFTLIAGCFGDVSGGPEVAAVNAGLIALAPELVDALRALVTLERHHWQRVAAVAFVDRKVALPWPALQEAERVLAEVDRLG